LRPKARERAREQEAALKERAQEEQETGKKKRGRKPKSPDEKVEDAAKANLTDPERRIMKTRKGFIQGNRSQGLDNF